MSSIARRMAVSSLCGMSSSSSNDHSDHDGHDNDDLDTTPSHSSSGQHHSSTHTTTHNTNHSKQSQQQSLARIERVKFGVALDRDYSTDLPAPLLVLILKLNKEAPHKKDVFRAPGHQANMKKLVHFLQSGRLVNIDNYSVYTIASVLKKFLRKLPGGVFGLEGEQRLFRAIQFESVDEKRTEIHSVILSLPIVTQRLLVLLFGTFKAIAMSSQQCSTGMTAEALGVSVAPSFFQSCVQDGSKFAKMEDVARFKVQ